MARSHQELQATSPIRRLAWAHESPQDLDVVYVSAPDLTVRRVRQRYTALTAVATDSAAVYRYESVSFKAELTVDGDGFVSDYPGLWRRVLPSEEPDA